MVEFDFGDMLEHHLENIFWYFVFFAAGLGLGFVGYYFLQNYPFWTSIYNAIWGAVVAIVFIFLTLEATRHRKR